MSCENISLALEACSGGLYLELRRENQNKCSRDAVIAMEQPNGIIIHADENPKYEVLTYKPLVLQPVTSIELTLFLSEVHSCKLKALR